MLGGTCSYWGEKTTGVVDIVDVATHMDAYVSSNWGTPKNHPFSDYVDFVHYKLL